MGFWGEFKTFAMRGNVIDLAVGIVIGAAFGTVVNSFVNDILMPPIGMVTGGIDFKDYKYVMSWQMDPKTHEFLLKDGHRVPASAINYGAFVNSVISFVIIAFAVFLLVKLMNYLHKKPEPVPVVPVEQPKQEILLTEIRDLLARNAR